MISFQPTADDIAFVEVARKFATHALGPVMRDVESTKQIPDNVLKEIKELGLLEMEEAASMGGLELSLTTQVQVQRALATGDLASMQGMPGLNDSASFFRLHNISLDKIDHPEPTFAYISELQVNHFSTLRLQENVLSGKSLPARGVKIATHFLIAMKNENDQAILLLLPYKAIAEVAEGKSCLGLAAANIGAVRFDNCLIDESNIIARGEEASSLIEKAEARIRVLQAAKQVGLMEVACDYATEYTATRKAFGEEIAKFQAVSFRIAKMLMEKRVSNHLVLEAAQALDEEHADAIQKSKKALFQAHQAVKFVTDSAVQLLGGHGYVQDYPVEKWMRDAQVQVMLYENEHSLRLAYGMELINVNEKMVIG